MWQVGRAYTFTPSGDADELLIKIVDKVPLSEAVEWYEKIYDRPFELDAIKAFRAVVVKAGHDADVYHRKGSIYYVFDCDYDTEPSMYGFNVKTVK